MAKHWIQQAISRPGALTKSADAAGEAPMAFAAQHQHDSGKTGNRARLALSLQSLHRRSGSKK